MTSIFRGHGASSRESFLYPQYCTPFYISLQYYSTPFCNHVVHCTRCTFSPALFQWKHLHLHVLGWYWEATEINQFMHLSDLPATAFQPDTYYWSRYAYQSWDLSSLSDCCKSWPDSLRYGQSFLVDHGVFWPVVSVTDYWGAPMAVHRNQILF